MQTVQSKEIGVCDICGQWRAPMTHEATVTVKVYTYEAITPYQYRIIPDPQTQHCNACWQKQMRGLAEQLQKPPPKKIGPLVLEDKEEPQAQVTAKGGLTAGSIPKDAGHRQETSCAFLGTWYWGN